MNSSEYLMYNETDIRKVAKLDGWVVDNNNPSMMTKVFRNNVNTLHPGEMRYDTKVNWIDPVIYAINRDSVLYEIAVLDKFVVLTNKTIKGCIYVFPFIKYPERIRAMFMAVVTFIRNTEPTGELEEYLIRANNRRINSNNEAYYNEPQ